MENYEKIQNPPARAGPQKYKKKTENVQKRAKIAFLGGGYFFGISFVFSGASPRWGISYFFVFSGFWGFWALWQARRIATLNFYDFLPLGALLAVLQAVCNASDSAPELKTSIPHRLSCVMSQQVQDPQWSSSVYRRREFFGGPWSNSLLLGASCHSISQVHLSTWSIEHWSYVFSYRIATTTRG